MDMEITFTLGLSAVKTGDETTREKRKKRKEEGPEKEAEGKKVTSKGLKEKVDDEFFEADSEYEGKFTAKDEGRKGKSAKGRKKGLRKQRNRSARRRQKRSLLCSWRQVIQMRNRSTLTSSPSSRQRRAKRGGRAGRTRKKTMGRRRKISW